jgi:predicted Zn-dependent peptidase
MLVHGRPLDPQELVAHIDAVDEDAVMRVARRIIAGRPTLAALGPVGKLEDYTRFAERLRP